MHGSVKFITSKRSCIIIGCPLCWELKIANLIIETKAKINDLKFNPQEPWIHLEQTRATIIQLTYVGDQSPKNVTSIVDPHIS